MREILWNYQMWRSMAANAREAAARGENNVFRTRGARDYRRRCLLLLADSRLVQSAILLGCLACLVYSCCTGAGR